MTLIMLAESTEVCKLVGAEDGAVDKDWKIIIHIITSK